MVISLSLEFGGYDDVLGGSGVLNITIEFVFIHRVHGVCTHFIPNPYYSVISKIVTEYRRTET